MTVALREAAGSPGGRGEHGVVCGGLSVQAAKEPQSGPAVVVGS